MMMKYQKVEGFRMRILNNRNEEKEKVEWENPSDPVMNPNDAV